MCMVFHFYSLVTSVTRLNEHTLFRIMDNGALKYRTNGHNLELVVSMLLSYCSIVHQINWFIEMDGKLNEYTQGKFNFKIYFY